MHQFSPICRKLHQPPICINIPNFHQFTPIWINLPQFVSIYPNLPQIYPQFTSNYPKCTPICIIFHKFASICPNLHQFTQLLSIYPCGPILNHLDKVGYQFTPICINFPNFHQYTPICINLPQFVSIYPNLPPIYPYSHQITLNLPQFA